MRVKGSVCIQRRARMCSCKSQADPNRAFNRAISRNEREIMLKHFAKEEREREGEIDTEFFTA